MPVSTTHSEYSEKSTRWQKMRAVIGGEDVIKGEVGDLSPRQFLPDFVPPEPDGKRYSTYLKRAMFIAYTAWTKKGLHGSVFRKDFEIDLPETLDFVYYNMDGKGHGIAQLSKKIVDENLTVGRLGILVDYPSNPNEDSTPRANIYTPENIINWKTTVINGNVVLSMVVLREKTRVSVDAFVEAEEIQYRVLLLDNDQVYIQQIYNDKNEKVDEIIPLDYNGQSIDEIPFAFIGAEDNTPKIDKPPLFDIANVNLAHYRNSADYEENMHVHGQGTLMISSELTNEQFKEANPNGVKVGSRSGHFIGPNGSAQLLQLNSSQALLEAMKEKVIQMIGIGARFIQRHSGNQRVEGIRMDKAQDESGLSTLVGNCSEGIQKVFYFMTFFTSGDATKIEFELNQDFFDTEMTAQEMTASIMLVDTGIWTKNDVRDLLREAGKLSGGRTNEDIEAEVGTDVF